MFQNYLITAWRNLLRNKLFSTINVAGLSIGIACVMLIILFGKDEVSYDRFHTQAPHIYRVVCETVGEDGRKQSSSGYTGMVQGPNFCREIPEVDTFVRIQSEATRVRVGSDIFEQNGLFVDDNFFSVFSFPLLSGNASNALKDKHSVVLSEPVATKLFGNADVVGRVLELPKGDEGAFIPFTVTGVVPRSPQNSSIQIGMLLPMSLNMGTNEDKHWVNFYLNTFLVLKSGADVALVERKMQTVFQVLAKDNMKEMRDVYNLKETFHYLLQPMLSMHLDVDNPAANGLTGESNPLYSKILGGIAIFILAIACINFVNLAVARSLKRSREVGIRKVVGGEQRQLMTQFLLESGVLCAMAFGLAVLLVQLALPYFNRMANKELEIDYLLDSNLVLAYIALFLVTSFMAGFYPAVILSRFNPVKTLYNRMVFGGNNYLSQGLVVLQFTLTTFLIVAAITIYRQVNFLTSKPLGYCYEDVVTFSTASVNAEKWKSFKAEILKIEGVERASARQEGSWFTLAKADGRDINFALEVIDNEYFNLYDIPVMAGRSFSDDFPADPTTSVLVNEAFMNEMGWKTHEGKQVDFFYDTLKYNVIGVVKDYHYESLLAKIRPQLFIMHPKYRYATAIVKLGPGKAAGSLPLIESVFHQHFPLEPFRYDFKKNLVQAQYEAEGRWKDIIFFASMITIFISCMGLFGLATLAAEKRIKEIGIRKVLGASVQGIARMLALKFVWLVFVSALIAFPIAWYALARWLQNYPLRVELHVWMFGLAGVIVLFLALVTVGFQSVRAAIANPALSLRSE